MNVQPSGPHVAPAARFLLSHYPPGPRLLLCTPASRSTRDSVGFVMRRLSAASALGICLDGPPGSSESHPLLDHRGQAVAQTSLCSAPDKKPPWLLTASGGRFKLPHLVPLNATNSKFGALPRRYYLPLCARGQARSAPGCRTLWVCAHATSFSWGGLVAPLSQKLSFRAPSSANQNCSLAELPGLLAACRCPPQ